LRDVVSAEKNKNLIDSSGPPAAMVSSFPIVLGLRVDVQIWILQF
jgi:hypothetical protein